MVVRIAKGSENIPLLIQLKPDDKKEIMKLADHTSLYGLEDSASFTYELQYRETNDAATEKTISSDNSKSTDDSLYFLLEKSLLSDVKQYKCIVKFTVDSIVDYTIDNFILEVYDPLQ